MRIGIFDSGIGGLTVARTYLTHPKTEVIYIADTAHMPYGNKSHEEVQKLTAECIDFLYNYPVDAIIIACHTATTCAGSFFKKKYAHFPLITMEDTIISQAVAATKNKHIALLATQRTIQSSVYQSLFYTHDQQLQVTSLPCPTLACTIEEHFNNPDVLETTLKQYLALINTSRIDTYVLGCTHYAFIKDILKKKFPASRIISSDETIADSVIVSPDTIQDTTLQKHQFFVRGDKEIFEKKLQNLLEYWNMSTLQYTLEKLEITSRSIAAR